LLLTCAMGKGGRGAKKGAASTKTAQSEVDALAEQQAKTTLKASVPSTEELLAALDRIMVFDLRSMDGQGREFCLSPSGEVVFYLDESDAQEALEARKQTHAGRLAMGCTRLGRAFGLTECQALGLESNIQFPTRLQGSSSIISAMDEAELKSLCPASLRKQMNQRTETIPMFSLVELLEGAVYQPYFFTHIDLCNFWVRKTGKKREEFPQRVVLTDLRVLIVRMMNSRDEFNRLRLMPTASSIRWLQAVSSAAVVNQEEQTKRALVAAEAAGAKALAAAVNEEPTDAPPPLQEGDEPPALS